ncbi:hypothetical protein K7G98_34360, partial [Saccharothrix sp. MB29]|nr:hypothetical protein [Saccharothrix sp. MB29]
TTHERKAAKDVDLRPFPRLVVVVDEFGELKMRDDNDDMVTRLVSVAQTGRSLGVHLLLATQMPEHVTNAIKANANLTVCLKVKNSSASTDVVGTGAAAAIGAHQKGRAIVRRADVLHEVQTAFMRAPVGEDLRTPRRVVRRDWWDTTVPEPPAHEDDGVRTDLDDLIDSVSRAASED